MTGKPPPEGRSDKDAEGDQTPMEKFRTLARELVRVAPDRLKEELARYKQDGKRHPKLKAN
jgi:hypothetical protein